MTRLIPPLLTAAAIWALCLAESQAGTRAALSADDPACSAAAEDAARDPGPAEDAAPAPGCPDFRFDARP